ncbi:hypothetical protein [Azonexus hydrophilus]|uniref:HTH marR-type domain-containing protein n=1 Tax=Azonexus hydrophilus TaxID=418702 RepID=A0ABZ2XKT2_9RHOO
MNLYMQLTAAANSGTVDSNYYKALLANRNVRPTAHRVQVGLSKEEERLIEFLKEPRNAKEIAAEFSITVSAANAWLRRLEAKERVFRSAGRVLLWASKKPVAEQ